MRIRFLFFLALLLYGQVSFSQGIYNYKPFKVDIGFGYGVIPSGGNGGLFAIEPSYTLSKKYKLGVQYELSIWNMKTIGSWAVTADYYWTPISKTRIFTGAGFSLSSTHPSGGCDTGPTLTTQMNSPQSGGLLRTGIEIYHFRVALEYHLLQKTNIISKEITPNGIFYNSSYYRNSYLGIQAGISIGGGPKKMK